MRDDASPIDDFQAFCTAYKPLIRPEGTLERMRRAFEVEVAFLEEYQILRSYLRRYDVAWSSKLMEYVSRARSASGAFDQDHARAFAKLYRTHAQTLVLGEFDEAYLDSVEDVALYMIHRDIKSVWLAGAYQMILGDMVDYIFERTERHRPMKIRKLVKLLSKAVAIEMNQIQRVFTVYETQRLETLVAQETAGGRPGAGWSREEEAVRAISPEHVARVRASFQALAPEADLLTRRLLATADERDPSLRALVMSGDDGRPCELIQTLGVFVRGLDEFHDLLPEIKALGRRHAEAGVTTAQYDLLGEVLLETLRFASGQRWAADTEAAWRAVYTALVTIMRAAEE